jgi:flagellar motor switch protein FliM
MSNVLTPEQIAALVDAAREGTLPEPQSKSPTRRPKRVREVDFTRPTKFTQDHQRRITRHHQAFCRTAKAQLSVELGTEVELEVLNVDQQTWVSAMQEYPQPSVYAVLATTGGQSLLLGLEHTAVMSMIERLLGGEPQDRAAERELTEVELALARRIFGAIIVHLSRTWAEMLETELSLGGVETLQSNLQLVPQSEPTLAVTMELKIAALSSTMMLLIPYRAVETLLPRFARGAYDTNDGGPDETVERMVNAALKAVSVEVRAEVGSRELSVDELMALRPGDVLKLGPSAAGGTLYADTVAIHRVRPGRSGRRRAVSVLDRVEGNQ